MAAAADAPRSTLAKMNVQHSANKYPTAGWDLYSELCGWGRGLQAPPPVSETGSCSALPSGA